MSHLISMKCSGVSMVTLRDAPFTPRLKFHADDLLRQAVDVVRQGVAVEEPDRLVRLRRRDPRLEEAPLLIDDDGRLRHGEHPVAEARP